MGEIKSYEGQIAISRETGKAMSGSALGQTQQHDGTLALPDFAENCFKIITRAAKSGDPDQLSDAMEYAVTTLGNAPEGKARAATAQLGKALDTHFQSKTMGYELRSQLGQNGLKALAQCLPHPTGKSPQSYEPPDLSSLPLSNIHPDIQTYYQVIITAYNSGNAIQLNTGIQKVVEQISDLPPNQAKAFLPKLAKALNNYFESPSPSFQLRNLLGQNGLSELAQTLPYPPKRSHQDYSNISLGKLDYPKEINALNTINSMIIKGYNSGSHAYLKETIHSTAQELAKMPNEQAKKIIPRLEKQLIKFFDGPLVTFQLRNELGKLGQLKLASLLSGPEGRSANDYSDIDLKSLSLSPQQPTHFSATEKSENTKQFIESFEEVVIYVPNTPNYGIQSITTRMIQDIRDNLQIDKPIKIATPEDEIQPWEQAIHIKVQIPNGEAFNQQEFLQQFATAGGLIKDYEIKNNVITLGKSVSGQPTNILELNDYITYGNDSAVIIEGPSDMYPNQQTRKVSDPMMTTIEINFTLRQPVVTTTADKVRELAPELANNPQVEFCDIKTLGESGKKTLLLSGPRDDRGMIDTNQNDQVTEIFLHDKDHHPEQRRIFVNGQQFAFPDSIESGARFPVKIDPQSIEKSELGIQAKKNLNSLIKYEPDILYTYGFHQVPGDKRDDLFRGLIEGAVQAGSKRPVVFIAGNKDIPALQDGEQIQLDDPNFMNKLKETTDQPLVIRAGQLPADVNDLLMSKAQLVLAEGKGSISKCQELGIKHLILPQASEDPNNPYTLKTAYHNSDNRFSPKQASLALYDSPSKTIRSYLREDHSESYKNMVSSQNLLTESISMLSHSLGHFTKL